MRDRLRFKHTSCLVLKNFTQTQHISVDIRLSTFHSQTLTVDTMREIHINSCQGHRARNKINVTTKVIRRNNLLITIHNKEFR